MSFHFPKKKFFIMSGMKNFHKDRKFVTSHPAHLHFSLATVGKRVVILKYSKRSTRLPRNQIWLLWPGIGFSILLKVSFKFVSVVIIWESLLNFIYIFLFLLIGEQQIRSCAVAPCT